MVANVFGLFLRPQLTAFAPANELAADVLVLLAALYLFLWSSFLGKTVRIPFSDHESQKSAASSAGMWLSEEQQRSGVAVAEDDARRNCESPLLGATDTGGWKGAPDWMGPDVIPADPFLHPGRDNPLTPKILSPAAKILYQEGPVVYAETAPDVEDNKDVAYYSYTATRRYRASTFNRI